MKTCGIYGVQCSVNNKWYVGGSIAIERRWATHKRDLISRKHTGTKLLRAWCKHGPDSWKWLVLEKCDPAVLVVREQYWIDRLDAYKNGYNSLPYVKQGTRGRTRTPEEISKYVATRRARDNYKHSEKTKKLIGDLQRGKSKGPMSEAQKQLLSRIKKEQGMPESERQRIAKVARERVYTEEIRENMSRARRGYIMSEAQKSRIAASNRGKPKSLESLAKAMKRKMEIYKWMPNLVTCKKYGLPLPQVIPACAVCGTEILNKKRTTCRRECFIVWQKRNARRRQLVKCVVCDTDFTPRHSGAKTCSRDCFRELARRGINKRYEAGELLGFKAVGRR